MPAEPARSQQALPCLTLGAPAQNQQALPYLTQGSVALQRVSTSPSCCRSEDAEAYELQDGELSSGIFMKYLKQHILQEKKVTHMLEKVLEGKGWAGNQLQQLGSGETAAGKKRFHPSPSLPFPSIPFPLPFLFPHPFPSHPTQPLPPSLTAQCQAMPAGNSG